MLDDGAASAEISLAMLQGLSDIGFEKVYATPHQKDGQFLPSMESIHNAYTATAERIVEQGLALTLGLAAENMWDTVFYQRVTEDSIPSYDGGDAFLFELPLNLLPPGLSEALFRLQQRGKLPVLAHPERYDRLWDHPNLFEELAGQCVMVVDLGAIAGYHGRKRNKRARTMLKKGLAHAVASDAHSLADVRIAAEGIRWIEKKIGVADVTRLLDTNPRLIASGTHPEWE